MMTNPTEVMGNLTVLKKVEDRFSSLLNQSESLENKQSEAKLLKIMICFKKCIQSNIFTTI